MATLETQYKNWLKENEPIEYSEWLEKFSEIHHLDKIIQMKPCDFDHNGECLICDCWPSNCAYQRYINGDYKYESKEELEKMFKDYDPLGNEKSHQQ